jgi:hypothetical protein
MGAKIDTVIPKSVHQSEYGPETYEYAEVKVNFHSVSDIFFIEQDGKELILDMSQLIELKEMLDKIF